MATLDVASISNPVVKAFLAGSMSGTFSTLIFQPLDLMKTRIQQQAELRLSMTGVVKNVLAQENVLGLWRGVIPSLVRTVPGVGLYFSSMHWMKSNLCEGRPSHLQSVLIGSSARAFAGSVMIPFTVIKTRFEANSYGYKTTYQAFRNILKFEGLRGLTSGLGPTLFRDVPFSGLYLMFYEHLKSMVPTDTKNYNPSATHFMCGFAAGILASLVTQPADVIKTSMQLDREKRGLVRTVKMIYGKQGLGGFAIGLAPRMLRRTLMAALAWTVYEKMIKTIGLN
eukprot:GFUD01003901.1.p1 GENE.GFUD01003901.1~~GFUD01003901.1.p1  ORF type:complete len:282 (+),score=37.32 GFUD01003901.1:631-1476(+)